MTTLKQESSLKTLACSQFSVSVGVSAARVSAGYMIS